MGVTRTGRHRADAWAEDRPRPSAVSAVLSLYWTAVAIVIALVSTGIAAAAVAHVRADTRDRRDLAHLRQSMITTAQTFGPVTGVSARLVPTDSNEDGCDTVVSVVVTTTATVGQVERALETEGFSQYDVTGGDGRLTVTDRELGSGGFWSLSC